jgi:hypothetical protein
MDVPLSDRPAAGRLMRGRCAMVRVPSGSWMLLGLLVCAFVATACGGGEEPYQGCTGETCSGHGTCVLSGGTAACSCETGWERDPDDPLACVQGALESVVVDVVAEVYAAVDLVVAVDLVHSRDVTLELGTPIADVWQDMLELSQQSERPVYLELVPETRRISHVEQPLVSPVANLREETDAVEVTLIYSAAIHVLYRSNPDFQDFYDLLQSALADGTSLVVTERDGEGIIDVRVDTF